MLREKEINDPNAIALATGHKIVSQRCIVLLKRIEEDAFIFFTNYQSKKGEAPCKWDGAFVIHWKTLQRQIRVRGVIEKEDGLIDEYVLPVLWEVVLVHGCRNNHGHLSEKRY